MDFKNYKTTLLGGAGAILNAVTPIVNASSGSFNKSDWAQLAVSVMMALMGYFAKDKDVTGVN